MADMTLGTCSNLLVPTLHVLAPGQKLDGVIKPEQVEGLVAVMWRCLIDPSGVRFSPDAWAKFSGSSICTLNAFISLFLSFKKLDFRNDARTKP